MFVFFVKSTSSEVSIGFSKNNFVSSAKVNVEFINDSITFHYPCSNSANCTSYNIMLSAGRYLLEVFGASGGNCNNFEGGKGGFSSGELTLGRRTHMYITIGGRGQFYDTKGIQPGGFNGGGNGWKHSTYGSGGGGATDIRINGRSLYNRVIVAGGGGGASQYFPGGFGGGEKGGNGLFKPEFEDSYACYVSGATQSSMGISQLRDKSQNAVDKDLVGPIIYIAKAADFGIGGSFIDTDKSGWDSAGGGGGWFGGTRGCVHSSSGSGGSGYVFTADSYKKEGYKLKESYQLMNAKMLNGSSSEIPNDVWNEKYPNIGNGAARITLLNYHNSFLWSDMTCICRRIKGFQSNIFIYIFAISK